MALVDVVLYVSICLSLCWLQLWLKGHTSLLVPHRVPHGAQHIFPTTLPQPWQLTYMSSFVNFDRTCLYIYFLETHTDAFLLSSSPSVTDSVVHTMGFSLNNVWDMHWYFFCMWIHCAFCVWHLHWYFFCVPSIKNIHAELWRFQTPLKTNRCNLYVHWIQQQEPISICEGIKSALHNHNPYSHKP